MAEAVTAKTAKSDFTTGSIPKKLISFMLPILGSLVLQAMYGAVDLFVVGRFGTKEGLSGVSTGSSMLNLVTYVIVGLTMGITVLIAHYLGEKKPERIGEVLGNGIILFAIIAILCTVLLTVFARPLAHLLQAPPEAVETTADYIRICGFGMIFITAYNVISSIFRGLGDSKSPLIFVAIACVVNIIGDMTFVAGFGLDAAGAALATVLAQAISVIISLIIIKHKTLPFKMAKKDLKLTSEIKHILTVGIPLAFQELMTQISFLALCAFINRLGLDASSGYGVASKIVAFVMLIPSSIMQSMASFISQNVGAGREDRARKAMATGMIFGACIGVIIFAFIMIRGDLLCMIFSSDKKVISNGWAYLKGFGAESIVTAFLFSFIGYFNGHEKTLFVMIQGIAQTVLVRLPFAYIMSIQPHASLTHIGWAAPLATVFGIIINLIYYIIYTRKIKNKFK